MCKFALLEIAGLTYSGTSNRIFKLEENGKCRFDDFWVEMKRAGNLKNDLDKAQTYLAKLEQGITLPSDCFKELPRSNSTVEGRQRDDYKDYELKVGRLRFYLFREEETGLIIVLGELKKDKKKQSEQIAKMRAIKLAYFEEQQAIRETTTEKIEITIAPTPENIVSSEEKMEEIDNTETNQNPEE